LYSHAVSATTSSKRSNGGELFLEPGSVSVLSGKLDTDLHLSKNSKAIVLKIEPWRAVNAHNGGLEAQNGALEGL
jgi:hypothetical protein